MIFVLTSLQYLFYFLTFHAKSESKLHQKFYVYFLFKFCLFSCFVKKSEKYFQVYSSLFSLKNLNLFNHLILMSLLFILKP